MLHARTALPPEPHAMHPNHDNTRQALLPMTNAFDSTMFD
jgi:hypothetical protein